MIPPKPTITRSLAPEGTHIARVIGIIYIGTIKGEYKGQPKENFKTRISWELPTELHSFKEGEAEKPYVVSKEVTLSMGKKSILRPIVEGIIGTSLTDEEAYGFDLDKIVGMPCLLAISHVEGDRGTYVSVNTATGLIKGITAPPQVNPTKILSFQNWDKGYFESLPDFIKDKIKSTPEYQNMGSNLSDEQKAEIKTIRELSNSSKAGVGDNINPDDIPF